MGPRRLRITEHLVVRSESARCGKRQYLQCIQANGVSPTSPVSVVNDVPGDRIATAEPLIVEKPRLPDSTKSSYRSRPKELAHVEISADLAEIHSAPISWITRAAVIATARSGRSSPGAWTTPAQPSIDVIVVKVRADRSPAERSTRDWVTPAGERNIRGFAVYTDG